MLSLAKVCVLVERKRQYVGCEKDFDFQQKSRQSLSEPDAFRLQNNRWDLSGDDQSSSQRVYTWLL